MDREVHSRYREDYAAAERVGLAIYDLIDSDTMLEREIAALVRADKLKDAQKKAEKPSPIQIINELMRLSNIDIEISLEEKQKVMARRKGSTPYSVAELSDGERNAFLIAAGVLTAAPESLVLIDEPERHLHRSIIAPLLTLLFAKRPNCAFIISTHEVMLPLDHPHARTLLIRSCEYKESQADSWTVDLLDTDARIDDDLKRDILGARKKILFVEGTASSLDAPLYSLLFPQTTIIPKENCRDVEHAVKSLRDAANLHWVKVWGIIDNDRRSPEAIARLKGHNVYALPHFSVEALYFHPDMIRRVADRQAKVTGENPDDLCTRAVKGGIEAVRKQKSHMICDAAERLVRRKIFGDLPTREDIEKNDRVAIQVDVSAVRTAEEQQFERFLRRRKSRNAFAPLSASRKRCVILYRTQHRP